MNPLLQLRRNPFLTPATPGIATMGPHRQNPFLSPVTPALTRPGPLPNPRQLLVRARRRRNPISLPLRGLLGKTSEAAFGAGAALGVNIAISKALPPIFGARGDLWIRWGVVAVCPWIFPYFPRLGASFAGAMWYSALWPVVEAKVKGNIFTSVSEALKSA